MKIKVNLKIAWLFFRILFWSILMLTTLMLQGICELVNEKSEEKWCKLTDELNHTLNKEYPNWENW